MGVWREMADNPLLRLTFDSTYSLKNRPRWPNPRPLRSMARATAVATLVICVPLWLLARGGHWGLFFEGSPVYVDVFCQISDFLVIAYAYNVFDYLWKRRMWTDLLMTPMSGREMTRGLLVSQTATYLALVHIPLLMMLLISLAAGVNFALMEDLSITLGQRLQHWALGLGVSLPEIFLGSAVSLWAFTRRRAGWAVATQAVAVVLALDLVQILVELSGNVALHGQGRPDLAEVLFGSRLYGETWVADPFSAFSFRNAGLVILPMLGLKVLIGVWFLRRTARTFHASMGRLLEATA